MIDNAFNNKTSNSQQTSYNYGQVSENNDQKVDIEIDGRKYNVPYGISILEACRKQNINIPTLCFHPDLCITGSCRMCLVEIEGMRTLQASCSYSITQPIKIHTTSEKVRKARRTILDLMISDHYGECYTCERNGNCQLQKLAKEYGVDYYRFGHVEEPFYEIDNSSYAIVRDMNKCILCRRCVRTCMDLQAVGVLGAVNRGYDTKIATFLDKPLEEVICINCGQCINRCPTGALKEKDSSDEVWQAIDNPKKHVVIQTAPSPRAAIGEEFGLPPGNSLTGELNTALKMMGFDRVFDTNFTADLTIMEEGTELLLRLKSALVDKNPNVKLPQLTSCSPGWIKFIEYFYPDYVDHLSTAKSPQQMFGAVIKTFYAQEANIDPKDIVSVSLMPCTAKKYECNRPEMDSSGLKDVDFALTTRELAQMIKEAGIYLPGLQKSTFDEPFGEASGAGLIFGATGGVMEAALRTAYELVTGRPVPFENLDITPCRGMEGVRQASVHLENVKPEWSFLEGVDLNFMIAHGTANAKKVMEALKRGELSNIHFIEIMACPGGCIGGGGEPIPTSLEIRQKRAEAIYKEDEGLPIRKSHENPHVKYIYEKFLTEGPCGHLSHKLLHTSYVKRGSYIV
ncbi:MAG TPA: NADH-dependent [FeFe] hydrogenase, group A6 [Candidatus Kapabacteria bacterium]|jgi:NADH-quinone oxidoreductase subunit G/[NiFe] hydrogenase diaphorase moiety small subunit|nr:[FeFe] hydrogenase, group A [Candidatus Kapabacteria bacterium]HOV92539.1 NADH-dependent [FeFe] hydrogenase, group A6 [Candidatus Kapabacteria bacterium]